MSFYDIYSRYGHSDITEYFCADIKENDILRILDKETLNAADFLSLLSPKAGAYIEKMAEKSQEITLKNFGKTIYLYAPLYLSNFCDNECAYCGFKHSNRIERKKLSFDEVEEEARAVSKTGLRHILMLTGESREESPVEYLKECARILSKYFNSISIEIYPLEKDEYEELIAAGVDGLTIYQETYDEMKYRQYHLKGPKQNYVYRLSAPERACEAKIRTVTVGALLGLSDFRHEIFFAGMHAAYLQKNYPDTEISVSFPRIRPQEGNFMGDCIVSDKDVVQMMLAMRLFLPRAGINISTRESKDFRKNLIGLGVTKMSAGSNTSVGGYALEKDSAGQFSIDDKSDVREVRVMIRAKGYQPVMKDWQLI